MMEKRKLAILVILLIVLPASIFAVREGIKLKLRAQAVPANIVIDAKAILGPMPAPWQALAQGGEDEGRAELGAIEEAIRELKPKYIRLDHIFDAYGLVSRDSSGEITYNWQALDRAIEEILSVGTKPFFSLSYMPPALAKDGNPVNTPNSWSDWENLVQATIEHYSGRDNKNLINVYYEVWNEPDLFGGWHMGCSRFRIGCDQNKDYKVLYYHSITGAGKARNVNPFKIGGPATTGAYSGWLDSLLDFCRQTNLRIDFFSWHRYSKNPADFEEDIKKIENYLEKHPEYANLEKIISEWGSDSENSSIHDGIFDAIHAIAVVRKLLARIDLAFSFEIKDGLSAQNQAFWGRWGLLTHENFGGQKKPRYYALLWLNKLTGDRLAVSGEGDFVWAMASKKELKIQALLVNFDPAGRNFENAPVTFLNLEPGVYHLEAKNFAGDTLLSEEIAVGQTGSLGRMFTLLPQSILFLTLSAKQ